MSPPERAFTAIVLAAQRHGEVDPLAAQASAPNKSLVPILGSPLIAHVVEALAAAPGLSRLRIVVEARTTSAIRRVLPRVTVPVEFVVAADNLADSVYAAARGVRDQAMVITTSDNVLLTPAAVDDVLAPLWTGADVTLALARREAVLAAHPEGQRRFYAFSDGAFSNCNLYALNGARATSAAESFRSGGQFAKKPLRMILALGPLDLALFLLKRLSLRSAIGRLARRMGLRIEPVILADGAHAIDVDNPRTFAAAHSILEKRRASQASRPQTAGLGEAMTAEAG